MKFSPCTGQCTSDGTHCQGCKRSHTEIKESKALVRKITAHLAEYEYDDPENFLKMLNKKSLAQLENLQHRMAKKHG